MSGPQRIRRIYCLYGKSYTDSLLITYVDSQIAKTKVKYK